MADMTTIKGRIAETIYPNGTGAITAESHQALLLEMVDTINAVKADADALDALEEKVDNLPQGGGNFNPSGTYPDLTAGDLAGRGESVPAEFGFRASGGKSIKDGRAYIKRIKGNSVVWNQKVKGFASWNLQGGTIEGSEAVWSAESRTGVLNAYSNTFAQHTTHKYLISADVKASSTNVGLGIYFTNSPMVKHTGSGNYESLAIITNGEGDGIDACYLTDTSTSGYGEIRAKNYRCIDLTQMFGAGNEPTTIEEYNARKPIVADEYAYNEGQVIHCNTESIKSVGDNAWDKHTAVRGAVNDVTGEFMPNNSAITCVALVKCLPGEEYYLSNVIHYNYRASLHFYDANMQFISVDGVWDSTGNNYASGKLRIPSTAHYMRVGTPYTMVDSCMVTLVHSGWKQDTDAGYQEYWQDTLPLPIISKYFPNGMKSAGTAHDEIRYNKASGKWEYSKGKIKSVDMGNMAWSYDSANQVFTSYTIMDLMTHPTEVSERNKGLLCSKYSPSSTYIASTMDDKSWLRIPKSVTIKDSSYTDAEALKASLQGVILYYESNDWEWVELDAEDQNFRDYYNVADFGTEMSQSSVPSAPFSADIIYQFNAVDMIREHEIEINELQDAIKVMQAQLASLTSVTNNEG